MAGRKSKYASHENSINEKIWSVALYIRLSQEDEDNGKDKQESNRKEEKGMETKVITICGSMRYSKEMMKISEELELKKCYAVIQCVYNVDGLKYEGIDASILDKIHRKKIDISDAIYVVNIDGYIGNSTKKEIEYALNSGKEVIYHEPIK